MRDAPCPCLICTSAPRNGDAGIVKTVEEHGWCALAVPGTYDFAFTVGLRHSFNLPEIAMFGLVGEDMQQWLNTCVARVRADGWPAAEAPLAGVIDGIAVQLRPIDASWSDAFFGSLHRFYRGHPEPVWQLLWSDAAGRWPWDEQATQSSRLRQPWAWLPAAEHPDGSWRLLYEYADGFTLPAEPDAWALTSRAVAAGERAPALVVFDGGAFDVLDDRGHDADDLCVAYLGHLVRRHPTLAALGDLPDGITARATGGGWKRAALEEPLRHASAAAWERGGITQLRG
ncbi:DUF4262 domain-containing protein [Dactylosporangium salmoneum]|uniref:DUF4262 domain-containing protein n=1 Tax=Dactylosporangium salmoneum TaxID=53361 RepID=A0ABN3HF26_9ACTN